MASSPPGQLSVTALSATLTRMGARFEILDPCHPSFIQELAGFGVALSNLHGPFGEDGRLQGLLDYLRIPYCGSGVAASAIAADKILCKRLMESLGVPTPSWRTWPDMRGLRPGHPVMVKPRMGGSSVGMSLVRRDSDLETAIGRAEAADPLGVLVEDYVPGLPVTVGLLELPEDVLVFPPLATRVHGGEFYDADAKLDAAAEGTVSCAEAGLPRAVLAELTVRARQLWDGLGCRGMARVDFIAADDGTISALEVNTTPGMSYQSNFIVAAGLCGLQPADVVTAILREALMRPRYDAPLPAPVFTDRPARESSSFLTDKEACGCPRSTMCRCAASASTPPSGTRTKARSSGTAPHGQIAPAGWPPSG
jgi:D-alanine-D-alanine ligase